MPTSKFIQAFDQVPQPQKDDKTDARTYDTSFGQDVDYDIDFPVISPETVDQALFNWYDIQNPIYIRGRENEPKKVKAIFSTQERWAMIRSQKEMRDQQGQLILPIISIRRTGITAIEDRTASVDEDGTANLVLYVHEKINAVTNKKEYTVLMNPNSQFPVVEKIEIQAPKICSFAYDVVFWSDYMQDLNDANFHMETKFGKRHAIYFNEKLWFHARLENITNGSNDDTIDGGARIFKSTFSIIVEAPLISKESIIRKKTIRGTDFSFDVGNDKIFPQEISDKIRNTIDWHDPYKLRR